MPARKKIAYSYVRFSDPRQSKGDSYRRQVEVSQSWCDRNGYTLDKEIFFDSGISGFRGLNITKGKLGAFIQLVETGRIKRGATLIVESLDRLSRNKIREAATMFLQLLDAGISIQTLYPEHHYAADDSDDSPSVLMDMVIMVTLFFAAHQKSQWTSDRVAESWVSKRKAIIENGDVNQIQKIPSWCYRDEDKNICLDESKAEIIEQIFDLFLNSGYSIYKVRDFLNENSIPCLGKGDTWHLGTIQRILFDRIIIGEKQFGKVAFDREGKKTRELISDKFHKVFPAAISEELFKKAQARKKVVKGSKGERAKSTYIVPSNLIRCGRCGSVMYPIAKSKDRKYWFCSGNYAKKSGGKFCENKHGYRVDEFEEAFLKHIVELDLSTLGNQASSNRAKKTLSNELSRLQEEVKQGERDIVDYEKKLVRGDLKPTAFTRVNKVIEGIESNNLRHQERIQEIEIELDRLDGNLTGMVALQDRLKASKSLKTISENNRSLIRQSVATQVEEVIMFTSRSRKEFQRMSEKEWLSFCKRCDIREMNKYQKKLRCFYVKFRGTKKDDYRLVRGVEKLYKNTSHRITKSKLQLDWKS